MSTRAREDSFLARIVSTVSSSLELDEVLSAVVRLLSDASAVHACFVYLVENGGDRLVLRAASEPYGHLVGTVELLRGEGLAWWAAERRQPAFIPENLLDDPRVKYVPELEEERFQSLLTVPIVRKDGDVIGVISAHTEAPREFTADEVDFLVTAASLVAGAIENASLYGEMRRRVHELEALTELAEAIAGVETLEELLPAELGPELSTRSRRGRVAAPLVADDELIGLVVADGTRRVELARAMAGQVAVGIKKVRLIERLTERNLVSNLFERLVAGRTGPEVEGFAARLGCDLFEPHLVLAAEPADDTLEATLAQLLPGLLIDREGETVRALVRVPRGGPPAVVESLRRAQPELGELARVGLSGPCAEPAAYAAGFDEARHALLATVALHRKPAVAAYGELGAHRYVLRLAGEGAGTRDAMFDSVSRLAEYDKQRQTQLLTTLEEFLRRRGNISATAEALFVHPNTLRQRLRRIGELADLDLRHDDWLEIEIAVKLVKLARAASTRA